MSVIELGEPPAAKENMATMRSVVLKDTLWIMFELVPYKLP